jgi:hypothetical protein
LGKDAAMDRDEILSRLVGIQDVLRDEQRNLSAALDENLDGDAALNVLDATRSMLESIEAEVVAVMEMLPT